jgi:hypothetical protein
MIRKVYEVDPLTCPRCGGAMRVVAFLTEHAVVDRIIDHLKLTFVAERLPPPCITYQRAREILSNLEKQKLDEAGRPALAKHTPRSRDKNQRLLFGEDREPETPEEDESSR